MQAKGFGGPDSSLEMLHLWSATGVDLHLQANVFWPLLSHDEQEKAQQSSSRVRSQPFIASRGLLRLLLGQYLNQNPQSLQLQSSENGKPLLMWEDGPPPIHFNVTHSKDRMLYGFSPGMSVGIDLEWINPDLNPVNVARRICSECEWHAFSELMPEKQQETFFKLWTRKEALIKLQGDRLFRGLKTYEVCSDVLVEGDWVSGKQGKVWVQDLNLWPDFAGAIATPSPPQQIKHFVWDGMPESQGFK